MKYPSSRKAGITLKELLVLVVCATVAVLVLLPNFMGRHNIESANRVRLIANGTGIYKAAFVKLMENQEAFGHRSAVDLPLSQENRFSADNPELTFENSSDYFVYLVTNDLLKVNWSYFNAMNVPAGIGQYDPEDPESLKNFKPENNAWCVVPDQDIESLGTPFLITRNLQAERLKAEYGVEERPTVKGVPYDDEALVVIRIGGSGEAMLKNNILWRNLNPTKADNLILRP